MRTRSIFREEIASRCNNKLLKMKGDRNWAGLNEKPAPARLLSGYVNNDIDQLRSDIYRMNTSVPFVSGEMHDEQQYALWMIRIRVNLS